MDKEFVMEWNGILFSLKNRRIFFHLQMTWMNLEDIMLSETSQMQKEKYCYISLIVEFKCTEYIEAEGRTVLTRGRDGGHGCCSKSTELHLCRMNMSTDLMHSMRTSVNITVWNTGNLLRE